MSKFDVESFYNHCADLFKNNIDAKVTEINNEKADSITIEAPSADQIITDFHEQILNFDFFTYYTLLEATSVDQAGSSVAYEVSMLFYVCFLDPEDGTDIIKKALRYTRALAEIFQEGNFDESRLSGLEIIQHFPQSAQFQNGSDWYKIGGVEIKGTVWL